MPAAVRPPKEIAELPYVTFNRVTVGSSAFLGRQAGLVSGKV
jgi:hypothetical protein